MKKTSLEYPINLAAQWLTLVGALVWGAIAVWSVNPVEVLLPASYRRTMYGLIGLSAAYLVICRFR